MMRPGKSERRILRWSREKTSSHDKGSSRSSQGLRLPSGWSGEPLESLSRGVTWSDFHFNKLPLVPPWDGGRNKKASEIIYGETMAAWTGVAVWNGKEQWDSRDRTAKPTGFADGVNVESVRGESRGTQRFGPEQMGEGVPMTWVWEDWLQEKGAWRVEEQALGTVQLVQAPLWTDMKWRMCPELPEPPFLLCFLPSEISSSTFTSLVPVGDAGASESAGIKILFCPFCATS